MNKTKTDVRIGTRAYSDLIECILTAPTLERGYNHSWGLRGVDYLVIRKRDDQNATLFTWEWIVIEPIAKKKLDWENPKAKVKSVVVIEKDTQTMHTEVMDCINAAKNVSLQIERCRNGPYLVINCTVSENDTEIDMVY